MKVVFLTPNIGAPGSFYEVFSDCLRVAARQLGVGLEVVAGSKERGLMVARGLEALEGPARPDYLLLAGNWQADRMLALQTSVELGEPVLEATYAGRRVELVPLSYP